MAVGMSAGLDYLRYALLVIIVFVAKFTLHVCSYCLWFPILIIIISKLMLKRLQQRFATKASTDLDKLNEYGYVPSAEEVEEPTLTWDELSERRRTFNFEGDYQCKLCPKKVIENEVDLRDHLKSKVSYHITILFKLQYFLTFLNPTTLHNLLYKCN
jgi:hypothetical protein